MRLESPTAVTDRPRRRSSVRRNLALVIGLVALFAQSAPGPANAAQTWTTNLYDSRAFLYQDPYGTACTAAATMIMLNTIAYRKTGGAAFRWTPYRVKNNTSNRSDARDMTSILWFARSRDTLSAFGSGSDPHGWRNALNYYGWGSAAMTNAASAVYADLEYTSYDAAVHAAVRAIAQYRMPVGILGWAGRHAQVMTGFVVDGENPATSDTFTVRYVYLSDPLSSDRMVNAKVSNATFKNGSWRVQFQAYRETDSPYDDPYRAGWKRSSVVQWRGPSEWYRRWVIVTPVRAVVPPTPTPTPTPTPPPTPDPTPDPTPTAEPTPTPTLTPAPAAIDPTPTPAPTPTAEPPATPEPSAIASAAA